MPVGVIKKLMADKGIGFILPDDRTADVFFHYSRVPAELLETLQADDVVEYKLEPGPPPEGKGPRAMSLVPYRGPRTIVGVAEDPFKPLARHRKALKKKPSWRERKPE
jgi:CspA family cold shock protein